MRPLLRRALPLLLFCPSLFHFVLRAPRPVFARESSSAPARSVTVPFIFENNRVFVELTFTLPDGSARKTLAFVDTGDPDFELNNSLVDALQIRHGKDLSIRLGDLPLQIDSDVQARFASASMLPGLMVEANLPSKVLRHYVLVLDYGQRTLTLAEPGALELQGTRVPFALNPKTALLAVQATVDGHDYSMAIDNGSAYTWIAQDTVAQWTQKHPEWQRGVGAVGHANMNGSVPELSGVDIRIPAMELGSLQLTQIGALGVSSGWDPKTMPRFFDWYSQKTPGPVVAFIGGNVLKAFRLTIDYANNASYWLRQQPDDAHDLDQVGITLDPSEDGKYSVLRVAQQHAQDSVTGIQPGDILLSIDGWAVTGATQGKVLDALHGTPGDTRTLRLQRHGKAFAVTAKISRF